MISWAVKMTSTAERNPSTSNDESSWRNFIRLRLARLHAELSMCMYSEHGLDPLIRPVLEAVCHLLMVVSNCMPGSAHSHAAWATWRNRSRAGTHRTGSCVAPGGERPLPAVDDRVHELVGHPDRVVGVLVLQADRVLAVEVHVEPGVTQHPRLALLDGLAPDEVLDVGMVGVEDDHLGGPPRLAART